MSIIERMAKKVMERRYSISDLDAAIDARFFGATTYTGMLVNEATALNNAAVFACTRVLAETLASVPFPLYRRLARGKERATDHYLYPIIHDAPNPEMTSYYWRETLQGHLGTWGNAYSEIDWDDNGRVRALWPLRPDKMIDIVRIEGKLFYKYRLPDKFSEDVLIPSYRILHIPFMGFNGVAGYSPITLAKETIGFSLGVEKYGATFYSKGGRPGGALKAPLGVKFAPDAKELLKVSWQEMHQGLDNQHRTAILEDGLEWQKIGVAPEEAQFLETRQFQKDEIATWYRIPPHMIGILEHATFSNIESQSLEFVTRTMQPWFVRWESIVTQKLLGPEERKTYFAEFLVDGLLRGDSAGRAAFYKEMFFVGALSPNDIRGIENMNPVEGGDVYMVPLNMVPLEEESKEPEPNGIPSGVPSDEDDAAENLVKGEKLNGAQITAAKEVIADVISGQLPPSVAIELLISVGVDRPRAESMVNAAVAFKPKELPEGNAQHNHESRANTNDGSLRRKTSQSWLRIFQEASQRVIDKERRSVSTSAKRHLSTGDTGGFDQWLEEFYKEHESFVEKKLRAPVNGLSDAIEIIAANEVNAEDTDTRELREGYLTSLGQRHSRSSKGQIQAIVKESTEEEDLGINNIDIRLDEWQQTRPGKMARNETVRLTNAIALTVFAGAGITKLMWSTASGDPCPFCSSLDGTVVGIEQNFIDADTNFLGENGQTLKVSSPKMHPPMHLGCQCQIIPQ